MDAPCCVGVVRDSSALEGKEVTIGKSQKAYYTAPKAKSGKRMGIVVVHDIFGFALPNCKYVVDYFASKGFDAVMPDLYSDKEDVDPPAWPATETEVTKPLEGEEFGKWFGAISSEKFWARFNEDMDEATAFLRRKGCLKFGIIGFCWGGMAAEKAALSGRFAAMVSGHGCAHTAATYKEVKGSSLYISVPDDAYFSKASQDEIVAAGGKLRVFDGMHHGFMIRGDFAGNAQVKKAADEALTLAETHFSQACLRKAKYTKVGSLNPDSSGFTLLVKVVAEVREVEEQRKSGVPAKFFEVTVGDETGQVTLSLKDFQTEGLTDGKVLAVRNASVRMVKGFMRIIVDKWGKLDKEVDGTVAEVGSRNLSTIEYELIQT